MHSLVARSLYLSLTTCRIVMDFASAEVREWRQISQSII